MSGWISVKDRLPKYDPNDHSENANTVIAWWVSQDRPAGFVGLGLVCEGGIEECGEGAWHLNYSPICTHWMPLPYPPVTERSTGEQIMNCFWRHKWSKWSDPEQEKIERMAETPSEWELYKAELAKGVLLKFFLYYGLKQERTCSKCNVREQRWV